MARAKPKPVETPTIAQLKADNKLLRERAEDIQAIVRKLRLDCEQRVYRIAWTFMIVGVIFGALLYAAYLATIQHG